MSMGKIESFLGKHIEGFFNKKFSSHLEFSEVRRQLEREVLHKKKKSRQGAKVPNAYFVEMCKEDYHRMCVRRFMDELRVAIERAVILNDCFMDNDLIISMSISDRLSEGMCNVYSKYQDDSYDDISNIVEMEDANTENEGHTRIVFRNADVAVPKKREDTSSTLVLNREDFNPPLNLPEDYKLVSLLAVEGPDVDSYLEFGEKQIYIGRRVKNDFILTDTNASRVHAYITYERHRHFLHDAGSLNGTYIKDAAVEQPQLLKAGDEIRIGGSVLMYDVLKD